MQNGRRLQMRYAMGGNDSLRISSIKDKNLQALANSFDQDGKNGILEGEELINFNQTKANYKPGSTVTRIDDLNLLRAPELVLNSNNIITVIENYEKDHEDETLFGAFMKDSSIPREERKNGLQKAFEILYNKVLKATKTDFQKSELEALKTLFSSVITEELDNSWFEWGVSKSEVEEIIQKIQKLYTGSSEELAQEIYDHIDENHFSYGDKDFRYLLNSIDKGNAISVAQKVKEYPKNKDGETLLKILAQEYTAAFSKEQQDEKKAQIKNFVNYYFEASGFKDTPYYKEAQTLLTSITDAYDTTSNLSTTDIDKLDSIMDSLNLKQPKDIAQKLYSIMDGDSDAFGRTDTKVLLDKINSQNINEILKEFENNPEKKSLLTMIDETSGNEEIKKEYVKKIVETQLKTTKFAKDKRVNEHVKASLKNESIADTGRLMKALGRNKDVEYMSKEIFEALSRDHKNIEKEAVKYLLDGIDKNNVMKFMEEFNKLSKGIPITEFLQKNGSTRAEEYILNITDSLLDANEATFDDEEFSATFNVLKTDVETYIRKNISDKEDISRVVMSFFDATPEDITVNIENIASDKTHAPKDISFKLWVAKINSENAKEVIKFYDSKYGEESPINAIIEEHGSDIGARQSQILHVLSALVAQVGEDRVDPSILADFNTKLEGELFGMGMASAKELNSLLNKIVKSATGETIIEETPTVTELNNIRPDVAGLDLGKKFGSFSWQYSKLQNIDSLQEIADLTGLSVDYLEEIKETEGYRSSAYKCDSGKKTIGVGHNFHNATGKEREYLNSKSLSRSEIYQILAYDLIQSIHKLQDKGIDTSKLTQGQFEALVDVSFNAPGYMNTLSTMTIEAIHIAEKSSKRKADAAFDEAAYQFNQQYSNSKIASGLCKRRIRNVLRFSGAANFKTMSDDSEAKKRIIILAKNGYNASSFLKKPLYIKDICDMLDISLDEFNNLEYPNGYKN